MEWSTPNAYNLDPGDEILPLRSTRIHVANSHKLAVACWRYWELVHPHSKLTYDRVQTYSYEGEPRPVEEIPGLFECATVKIIERVPDGSGSPPGTERYSDVKDLWPLIKTTQWPHGSPMYDDRGYIVNQPNLTPAAGLDQFVEALPRLRHRLPFFYQVLRGVEFHLPVRVRGQMALVGLVDGGGEVIPPPADDGGVQGAK
jgi:hypothetical protein